MQVIYMVVFLLTMYAAMTYFDINITDVITINETEEGKHGVKKEKKKKRFSMADHKAMVEGSRYAMGGNFSWEKYLRLVVVCSLMGATIGFATNNFLLAIVLFVGFALLPYFYIQLRTRSYVNMLHGEMEQAIAIITNNYIQVPDVLAATEEALKTTSEPMKGILNSFCREIKANVSAETALKHIRPDIDDRYWREWIDRMVQCQTNSSLRPMLAPIPKVMSEQRQQQMELDTIMRKIWSEHLVVAGLSIGAIPFIMMINADWGKALTTTTLGKLAIALDVFIVLIATLYAYVVNKPLYAEV